MRLISRFSTPSEIHICSISRNTYNKQIIKELPHVFELCDKDDRVRVVILTAEPTAAAYCSGVCFKKLYWNDLDWDFVFLLGWHFSRLEPTLGGRGWEGGWTWYFQPYFGLNPSISLLGPPAHRDSGGIVSIAIMRCRKITIAAINGHAVSNSTTFLFL